MRAHTSSAWRTAAALAAMVLLGHAALAQPATFTPIPIGTPQLSFGLARGVSADGVWVVGETAFAPAGRPVRWSAATGSQLLLDGGGQSYEGIAWAASADGSVIVGEIRRVQGGQLEAYRWTATGGFQSIAPPGTADARDVSDDGSVVVGTQSRAYRWTEATGVQLLPPASGNLTASLSDAISADGSTIIGRLGSPSVGVFRWSAATGTVRIDVPAGVWGFGIYNAISADGRVVWGGGDRVAPPPAPFALARWTLGGGWRVAAVPPRTYVAVDCRSDGRVVVGDTLPYVDHTGFIWDPLNGARPFKDYLISLGANGIEGWTGITLTGISADGTVVAGTGTTPVPPGGAQSFVATIPRFCYPNCDGSGNPWTPTLTPADFVCFLRKFREGLGGNDASAIYADCDPAGPLDAADFSCFLREFSAGCR